MKRLILAAVLASASHVALADSHSAALAYGWHAGITTRVEYAFEKKRTQQGVERGQSLSGSYVLRTSEHPGGIRIDFSEVQTRIDGDDGGAGEHVVKLMEAVASNPPAYVVSPAGEVTEVVGLAELTERTREVVASTLDDAPAEVRERLLGLLAQMLTERNLLAQLQQEWNRDVGQWIGAELEQGYLYEIDFEAPVPLFGNVTVPSHGTYEYLGRTKCDAQSADARCVILAFNSSVDEQGSRPILEALFNRLGVTPPDDLVFTVDYRVELVTEPDTLLPHRVQVTKSSEVPVPGGDTAVSQLEVKEFTYTYIDR